MHATIGNQTWAIALTQAGCSLVYVHFALNKVNEVPAIFLIEIDNLGYSRGYDGFTHSKIFINLINSL